MTAIVISYRREDSQATTGRIFDRLESVYGQGHVFMDIDNIPFGMDFRHHLQDTLDRCDVLLVIVGPRWYGRKDNGSTRLFEEADWVRLEVATALKKNVPVIPVLVEGARMPTPSELPLDLESFAFRQAATIDIGVDFRVHMERLIKSMDRILGSSRVTGTAPISTSVSGLQPNSDVSLPAIHAPSSSNRATETTLSNLTAVQSRTDQRFQVDSIGAAQLSTDDIEMIGQSHEVSTFCPASKLRLSGHSVPQVKPWRRLVAGAIVGFLISTLIIFAVIASMDLFFHKLGPSATAGQDAVRAQITILILLGCANLAFWKRLVRLEFFWASAISMILAMMFTSGATIFVETGLNETIVARHSGELSLVMAFTIYFLLLLTRLKSR